MTYDVINSQTSLDVVICTYNNARLLRRTLESLTGQNSGAGGLGVLVVNNNCTDETDEVVKDYTARIPRLRSTHETRQGLTWARLCGVNSSTASWIAFVDDDCLLEPNWVANAISFASKTPECGAFGGRVVLDWEEPPPAYVNSYRYAFAEQDHGAALQRVEWLVGAGMVVNRAALERSGWVRKQLLQDRIGTRLVSGGDMEIALRIASAGLDLWYVPNCVLRHFIPRSRTSVGYLRRLIRGLGAADTLCEAIKWPESYWSWVWNSLRVAAKESYYTARMAPRNMSHHGLIDLTIRVNFTLGRLSGLSYVVAMKSSGRRELIGVTSKRAGARHAGQNS